MDADLTPPVIDSDEEERLRWLGAKKARVGTSAAPNSSAVVGIGMRTRARTSSGESTEKESITLPIQPKKDKKGRRSTQEECSYYSLPRKIRTGSQTGREGRGVQAFCATGMGGFGSEGFYSPATHSNEMPGLFLLLSWVSPLHLDFGHELG